jgi:hypothetical protein
VGDGREAGDVELCRSGMPWISDLRLWSYDVGENIAEVVRLIEEHGLQQERVAYDDMVSPIVVLELARRSSTTGPPAAWRWGWYATGHWRRSTATASRTS